MSTTFSSCTSRSWTLTHPSSWRSLASSSTLFRCRKRHRKRDQTSWTRSGNSRMLICRVGEWSRKVLFDQWWPSVFAAWTSFPVVTSLSASPTCNTFHSTTRSASRTTLAHNVSAWSASSWASAMATIASRWTSTINASWWWRWTNSQFKVSWGFKNKRKTTQDSF